MIEKMIPAVRPLFSSLFFAVLALATIVPSRAAAVSARPLPVAMQADYDVRNPPGRLRVLVGMGASSFFFKQGRPHGVEYAMLLDLEKFLNRGRSHAQGLIRLQYIPVSAGELLPALQGGQGDLAVGLIPALPGIKQVVSFTQPYLQDRWCLVGRRSPMPDLDALKDDVLTLPHASLGRHALLHENTRRLKNGKPALAFQEALPGLTGEMQLAAIHNGDEGLVLASRYQIGLWNRTLPQIRAGACLEEAIPLAWAVRKESPHLLELLNRFLLSHPDLPRRAADLTRRHLVVDGKVTTSPRAMAGAEKLALFAPVFQMVGHVYEIDWLLLAAIGQQETTLRHVVSKAGPTGVMQVNPATARQMGIQNPHDTEQNITAAARYLHYLREYFRKPEIAAEDQFAFVLAAYNAGEGRLQQLRRQAAQEGLNPNRWDGHVERVARRMVGGTLTYYVSAVGRYYRDFKKDVPDEAPLAGATANPLIAAAPPMDLF